MLTLYSTEKIISTIYSDPSDKYTHWINFIERIHPDLYILLDPDSTYDTDDSNPAFLLTEAYELRTETDRQSDGAHKAYIDQVIDFDVHEIKNPQAVFLLDIDNNTASEISSRYGVICHAFGNPIEKSPLVLESLNQYFPSGPNEAGWNKFFKKITQVFPSNSLIFIDRYLFAGKNDNDIQTGIDNIHSILNHILPSKLEANLGIDYHILVIFDVSKTSLTDDTPNAIIDKERVFNRISTKLNKLKKKLNKPYNIITEALSIERDCHPEHYNNIHNRRVLSNYFLISADHSLKAFDKDKSLRMQNIRFSWAASEGVLTSIESSIPYKELKDYISKIQEAIKELKNSQKEYYSQNGDCTLSLKEIKNRLITQ